MDSLTLLSQIRQERADLDATIRTLESRLGSKVSTHTTVATKTMNARKGHRWTQAQRDAMSKKLRASWKARQAKKSAKK